MSSNFRVEHDFLGEKQIPADAYWGVHTARARRELSDLGHAASRPCPT